MHPNWWLPNLPALLNIASFTWFVFFKANLVGLMIVCLFEITEQNPKALRAKLASNGLLLAWEILVCSCGSVERDLPPIFDILTVQVAWQKHTNENCSLMHALDQLYLTTLFSYVWTEQCNSRLLCNAPWMFFLVHFCVGSILPK